MSQAKWLTSVIPATREAILRGSQFQISLGKVRPPCQNKPGIVVPACDPSHSGGAGRRIEARDLPQAKMQDPI
jgi:hypothetical protein